MRILLRFFFPGSALILFSLNSDAQDTTNRGREFWVGYGHHQFMEQGTNTQNMVLYLATENQAATVIVTLDSSQKYSVPNTPWKRTYNIPANTVIISNVIPKNETNAGPSGSDSAYDARLYSDPPPAGSGGVGLFRRKGLHIESDVSIAVHAHIYGSASSGATMLLPVEAWGHRYTCINGKQSYVQGCYSWAYIIAKDDNTVIQIIPSVITRGQNLTGLQPGVAKTITLQKGQIYQLIGANEGCDANGNGGTSAQGKELSGTVIRSLSSGKPIAVFCGSDRTSNPAL